MIAIKKYLRILKVFFKWVFISVSTLVLILLITLSFSPTQTIIAKYGANYLSKKTNKQISISYINIGIFSGVDLKNIFIEDNNKDTLLSASEIKVEVNLISALFGDIKPNNVMLDNVVAKIKIDKDSIINFDYLIKAFNSNKNDPGNKTSNEIEGEKKLNLNLNNVDISINKTKFVFYSETAGVDLNVNIGLLKLTTYSLDISNLKFTTKEIYLKDAIVSLNIFKATESEDADTTQMKPIYLDAKSLDFENIAFYFDYSISDLKLFANAKKGFIVPKQIDINNGKYFAETAKIDGANVGLTFLEDLASLNADTISSYQNIILVPDVGIEAGTQKVEITNSSFKLDYKNLPDTSKIFDSNHMYFNNLNLFASNAEYLKDEMHADIKSMSGSTKNESIAIKNLKGSAILRNTKMQVSDLQASSNKSNLKGNFKITYNNFNDLISDSLKFNTIKLQIDESSVDIADVNYFFNTESLINTDSINNTKITMQTLIYGNPDSLNVENINLNLFNNSKFISSGKIKELNNLKNINYDFDIKTLNISEKEIAIFTNNEYARNLNYLVIKGKVKGNMQNINTQINALTNFVEIDLDLAIKDTTYLANIDIINSDLSVLFSDSTKLKNLYANITIDGSGFDYTNNKTNIKLLIDSVIYNNLKNTNISLNIKSENGKYHTLLNSKNQNLSLYSNIYFEFKDSIFNVATTTNIKNINLQWLGLTKEKSNIKLDFISSYQGKNTDSLQSNIDIKNCKAYYKNEEYELDNLIAEISVSNSLSDIKINSDYIDGFVKANFNITETQERFTSFISDYFLKLDSVKKYNTQISFSFNINDNNIINRQLIPDLNSLSTSEINGNFNSNDYSFNLDASINNFNYDNIFGDSIIINFDTKNEIIDYAINLNKVNLSDSFFVDNLRLSGFINKDSLSFEFNNIDNNYSKYYFGASLVKIDSISRISFYPKVIIDSVLFDINESNFVDFGRDYLKFGEISVVYENQKIIIKPSVENGDINAKIEHFNLNLLSRNNFTNRDLLAGELNVTATLNINGDGNLTAKINNFKILNEKIGSIDIESTFTEWKYALNSQVISKDIDLNIKTNNKNNFVANSTINKLNLSLIKPFLKGYFKTLEGNITGKFNFEYSNKVFFNGALNFDNVTAHSKLRNANLSINNQTLKFSNEIISFNNFTIKDTANNKFIMNGKLYDLDYNYFKSNIELTAKNFTFFDMPKQKENRFFGKIIIDNKSTIKGDINKLKIVSDIKFLKGTKITYVFPENELMSMEKPDGIVEFITNKKDSLLDKDTIVDNWYSNLIMQSNIVVDKNTEINIVFNDMAGESISILGGGNINFDINEGGTINLNGDYLIEDGKYNLSYYEIVKREFNLKKGSRIIWTGDPYNPIADITASYKIKTNPYPLMVTEGGSQTELNKYRTNQIFFVDLRIQGMMLYPEMSFAIEYPKIYGNSNDQALRSKINMINSDPEKANKQAISLLVISSFITDEGNIANGGETFVNNSVSSILTSQLNKYSGKFVKGVDFNFDVNRYSAYNNASASAEGSQTDVKIEVKKKMFNDRVVVEVAGGVSLESQTSNNQNTSIHDAAIEYYITEDGKYKLRVFSEKDYSSMEQDVQSSGISFIFTTEFDRLNELFGKNIDAKEKEQEPINTKEKKNND